MGFGETGRNVVGLLARAHGLAKSSATGLTWFARTTLFSGALLWVLLVVRLKTDGSGWLLPTVGLAILLAPGAVLWWFAGMVRSMANLEMADDLRDIVSQTRGELSALRQTGLIASLFQGLWTLARRRSELMEVAGKTMVSFKLVTPAGLLIAVFAALAGTVIIIATLLAVMTMAA